MSRKRTRGATWITLRIREGKETIEHRYIDGKTVEEVLKDRH